jgi:aspartokinase
MSVKKPVVEVHKFGGASLADGAAYRHAVSIVKGRPDAPVVVVSAPGGITDALLGLATRAVAGERGAAIDRDVAALRARYQAIAKAAVAGGKASARAATTVAAEIDRSIDELAALLSSLAALKELTPRTRDFVVSRGERLSAQIFAGAMSATGTQAVYVDATEIVFTEGPFGGASPNLALTDLAVRKKLQPLVLAGKVPVVPGCCGSARIEDENGTATEERAAART